MVCVVVCVGVVYDVCWEGVGGVWCVLGGCWGCMVCVGRVLGVYGVCWEGIGGVWCMLGKCMVCWGWCMVCVGVVVYGVWWGVYGVCSDGVCWGRGYWRGGGGIMCVGVGGVAIWCLIIFESKTKMYNIFESQKQRQVISDWFLMPCHSHRLDINEGKMQHKSNKLTTKQ